MVFKGGPSVSQLDLSLANYNQVGTLRPCSCLAAAFLLLQRMHCSNCSTRGRESTLGSCMAPFLRPLG